jgi:hypothetical protein
MSGRSCGPVARFAPPVLWLQQARAECRRTADRCMLPTHAVVPSPQNVGSRDPIQPSSVWLLRRQLQQLRGWRHAFQAFRLVHAPVRHGRCVGPNHFRSGKLPAPDPSGDASGRSRGRTVPVPILAVTWVMCTSRGLYSLEHTRMLEQASNERRGNARRPIGSHSADVFPAKPNQADREA